MASSSANGSKWALPQAMDIIHRGPSNEGLGPAVQTGMETEVQGRGVAGRLPQGSASGVGRTQRDDLDANKGLVLADVALGCLSHTSPARANYCPLSRSVTLGGEGGSSGGKRGELAEIAS